MFNGIQVLVSGGSNDPHRLFRLDDHNTVYSKFRRQLVTRHHRSFPAVPLGNKQRHVRDNGNRKISHEENKQRGYFRRIHRFTGIQIVLRRTFAASIQDF